MKKKSIIIILSSLLLSLALLSACSDPFGKSTQPTDTSSAPSSDAEKIKELETQILALMQSQQLSEAERKKEIAALTAQLEQLKGNQPSIPSSGDESTQNPTELPSSSFKYALDGSKAIITEIIPQGDSVIIPAVIDGYQVYAIGSEALSSKTVKSVIVAEGIEKLDWFAFSGCMSLSSVTLPDSIVTIGYGAFDNTAKSLTIICSRDSFAHNYAQSYGITYDLD